MESAPDRSNLICRYKGSGEKGPLLITAHLDVVEAFAEHWRYPPFSGEIAEGCLWGRGAIDMKNMAAMCTTTMGQLKEDNVQLKRDVIFAAVVDEEAGCEYGSRWLVANHRNLVEAEYAIGESGGFSLHVGNSTFYPIQVAEKGVCWVRAKFRGEPGHGSMPRSDSAIVQLGEAIAKLGKNQLPVHPTPYVKDFLETIAAKQPTFIQPLLKVLTHPKLLPSVLKVVPDKGLARGVLALLSNTAAPTIAHSGSKVNVIPGEAELCIDGRTLPGQSEKDFLRELRAILGPDVEFEVLKTAPAVVTEPIESELYSTIKREIEKREQSATVVPYMIPGFTDAKYFTEMGAKWYGFSPVKIEKGSGIRFAEMFHGHNERVPVKGLHWGAEILYDVVREFCW